MSSTPPIEPFTGNGPWKECNDFIRATRAAAWKEGKLRDPAWMADFASLHFSGDALIWHSQLPEDVSQDWSKLQTSILTRWAPPKGSVAAKIEPTPAAAPSATRSDKSNLPLRGVLKVVVDESNAQYYVKFPDGAEACSLTTDVNKAFRVRCYSLSHGTLLERMDHSCHAWLAVHWPKSAPNIGHGSIDYAGLSFVDSNTPKSSRTKDTPWQLIQCNVSANGEVSPVWKKDETNKIPLFPFVYEKHWPYLVTDPVAYSKKNPQEQSAKMFIDPIITFDAALTFSYRSLTSGYIL